MRWCGVLLVVAVSACDETCPSGESLQCTCADGRAGLQRCAENGHYFETCECGSTAVDAGVTQPVFCTASGTIDSVSAPWRVPVGSHVVVQATAHSPVAAQQRWSWSTSPELDAGSSTGSLAFDPDRAGVWTVTGVLSSSCQGVATPVDTVRVQVEVASTLKLPFAVADVACCDAEGGAYLADPGGRVVRFDGESLTTSAPLTREPRHLALSTGGATLLVTQDGWFTALSVPGLQPVVERPVAVDATAVAGDDEVAWLFSSSGTIRAPLDGGADAVANTTSGAIGAVPVGPGRWVLNMSNHLGFAQLAVDGGLHVVHAYGRSICGGAWAGPDEQRVLTGCSEVLSVRDDGGFAYAGSFADSPSGVSRATTIAPGGDIFHVAAYSVAAPCGRSAGGSLEVLGSWDCTLADTSREQLVPFAFIPARDGGVWAVTRSTLNDVTWLERAP